MITEEVLARVARLPLDFKSGRRSAHALIADSGYRAHRGEINVDRLERYLATEPDLVDAWLVWSGDNRGWPAWYIEPDGHGRYEVGYYDGGRSSVQAFDDKVRACAEYVHRELEHLADQADIVGSIKRAIRRRLTRAS